MGSWSKLSCSYPRQGVELHSRMGNSSGGENDWTNRRIALWREGTDRRPPTNAQFKEGGHVFVKTCPPVGIKSAKFLKKQMDLAYVRLFDSFPGTFLIARKRDSLRQPIAHILFS